jgi:hypothetical protein
MVFIVGFVGQTAWHPSSKGITELGSQVTPTPNGIGPYFSWDSAIDTLMALKYWAA